MLSKSGEEDTLFRLAQGDEARLAIGKNETGALKTKTASLLKHMTFYFDSSDRVIDTVITQIAGDKDGLGRAYVWNTFRYASEGMLYHAGGTFGTSSWIALYPREKLGVFLVTPYVSPSAQDALNGVSNRIVERLRELQR